MRSTCSQNTSGRDAKDRKLRPSEHTLSQHLIGTPEQSHPCISRPQEVTDRSNSLAYFPCELQMRSALASPGCIRYIPQSRLLTAPSCLRIYRAALHHDGQVVRGSVAHAPGLAATICRLDSVSRFSSFSPHGCALKYCGIFAGGKNCKAIRDNRCQGTTLGTPVARQQFRNMQQWSNWEAVFTLSVL
jgi:hypothetical protein